MPLKCSFLRLGKTFDNAIIAIPVLGGWAGLACELLCKCAFRNHCTLCTLLRHSQLSLSSLQVNSALHMQSFLRRIFPKLGVGLPKTILHLPAPLGRPTTIGEDEDFRPVFFCIRGSIGPEITSSKVCGVRPSADESLSVCHLGRRA